MLYVGSTELAHFDELDVELLELLAERLAVAFERVGAFESERSARIRAQRDADHLARLQRVTSELATATSYEEIAASLKSSLNAEASGRNEVGINVWLSAGNQLVLVRAAANGVRLDDSLSVVALDSEGPLARAGRGLCRRLLRGGEPPPLAR